MFPVMCLLTLILVASTTFYSLLMMLSHYESIKVDKPCLFFCLSKGIYVNSLCLPFLYTLSVWEDFLSLGQILFSLFSLSLLRRPIDSVCTECLIQTCLTPGSTPNSEFSSFNFCKQDVTFWLHSSNSVTKLCLVFRNKQY